jgi:hypothetical protein
MRVLSLDERDELLLVPGEQFAHLRGDAGRRDQAPAAYRQFQPVAVKDVPHLFDSVTFLLGQFVSGSHNRSVMIGSK